MRALLFNQASELHNYPFEIGRAPEAFIYFIFDAVDFFLLFATADSSYNADDVARCVAILPATAVIAADDEFFAVDFYDTMQDIAAVGRTVEHDVIFFERLCWGADNNRVSPLFEERAHTYARGVDDHTAESGDEGFIRYIFHIILR